MTGPGLYIFGGLPGTGKSTLAAALADRLNASYVRIDRIEQELRDCGHVIEGSEGYEIAYGLALDDLRKGKSVVADSVNPLSITRNAWTDVAGRAQALSVEIEVICSDRYEHRRRIESRTTDIVGLELPDWKKVLDREYEAWVGDHVIVDTAGKSSVESIADMLYLVNEWEKINEYRRPST